MNATLTPVRWTLHELAARVAVALANDYPGQSSGRVTDVPNARTLRYYTTLGLLDRPAELRGRTAYYAERHLSQIVAIKRLQAEGLPLGEIQTRLHALPDGELSSIARVPALALAPDVAVPPAEEPANGGRAAFWRTPPADVDAASAPFAAAPPQADWQGVSLSDALLLLFTPARPLDAHDREALRAAAAPLLNALQTRGLVKPQNEE